MAENSRGSIFSSITPQQVLAILTLISSTVLLQFEPLQSRREMDRATAASTPADDHKFPASHLEDPLTAIKDSDENDVAAAFVAFVLSDAGQEILAGYGFLAP